MDKIPQQAVIEELHNISTSKLFSGAGRAWEFLNYVVGETLAGRADRLKGYRIGIDVFKRQDDFDAEKSSIVRVEAQRLRHLLERYYLAEGRHNAVRIDLPKGRYIPLFVTQHHVDTGPEPEMGCEASIAVLPLRNLSGNPEQQYIADGLTEELTMALGSHPDLCTMSSHATAQFEGKPVNPQHMGQSLCVNFLVLGSTRLDKRDISINIELVDVSTGKQIWSKKYKKLLSPDTLLEIQEEVSKNVVAHIADRYLGAIPRTLSRILPKQPASNLTTYEATLYLHHYNKNPSLKSYRTARLAMEKAALVDPDQAMVWAALGELRLDGYAHFGMERDRDVAINMGLQCTANARNLDPECEYCYWVEGQAYMMAREPEHVVNAAETILAYQPSPSSIALAGWLLAGAGQWERGLGVLQDQIEILRYFPSWFHHPFFLDHLRRDEYQQALRSALAFTNKGFIWGPLEKAVALSMLGRSTEGKQQLAEVQALRPDFADDPRRYLECFIMQDDLVDKVIEGLQKAGMHPPGQPTGVYVIHSVR